MTYQALKASPLGHRRYLSVLALFLCLALSGCNAEQIAVLEAERDSLAVQASTSAERVTALDEAMKQAIAVGQAERAELLAAAKVLEEANAKKIAKLRKNNDIAIDIAKEPNQAIQDGVETYAPLLPPPFNYLLPILTAGIFGETARRRGNRKVQKVGEVLEMAGAVSFKDSQRGMAASGAMGDHINAHLSIGRDKAKARISEVFTARGPIKDKK